MNSTALHREKLRQARSLANFSDAELDAFLGFTEVIRCPQGATLFEQGSAGDAMFLIIEGQLRVFTSKPDGKTDTLRLLAAGDAVGDIALFHGTQRSASVGALSDCVLLKLTEGSLQHLRAEQSQVAAKFLFALARSLSSQYRDFR